jgi:hypothetical protein
MNFTNLELSGQDAPGVDVAGVGFDAFVVSQNLGGGGRWHRRQKERVPDAVSRDLRLQGRPVVKAGGRDIPHVVLEKSNLNELL